MCDIKDSFKLCTCNKIDKGQNHWKLYKKSDQGIFILGEPNLNYYTSNIRECIDQISEGLNRKGCFDFDYEPEQGDRIIFYIHHENKVWDLCYDYNDMNEWHIDYMYQNKGNKKVAHGVID